MSLYRGTDISIPGTLNITLALGAYGVAAFFLWAASHTDSVATILLVAAGFSYVGNTIFSLLHESVHGIFHNQVTINDAFGRVSAAFFPTGFMVQRFCHLGHHRRNRTDEEMFDQYAPGGSRFLRYYQLYCLLTGFYWLSVPTGCVLVLLFKNLPKYRSFRERIVRPMGLNPMLTDLEKAPGSTIRMEIAGTMLFQAALMYGLNLTVTGWLTCYVAFALNWCSLQYTDHAWTVRDIRNGAWNLRVNKLVQFIFLNYHHHLAHHQHPKVPWIHLHKFVDLSQPRPSFLRTYLSLWAGPRLCTQPPPKTIDPDLALQLAS